MTKIVKKIKRIKGKLIKPVEVETPLPDLSVWNVDEKGNPTTPVYIESSYIAEQPNEFRKDYRKVIMCIITLTSGNHVEACRKMYNLLVAKWKLGDNHANSESKTYTKNQMLTTTICGYIENLLMQLETKYNIQKIAREL